MAILLVILAAVSIILLFSLIPTILWFCVDQYWAEVFGNEQIANLHFGSVWLTTFIIMMLFNGGSSTYTSD